MKSETHLTAAKRHLSYEIIQSRSVTCQLTWVNVP